MALYVHVSSEHHTYLKIMEVHLIFFPSLKSPLKSHSYVPLGTISSKDLVVVVVGGVVVVVGAVVVELLWATIDVTIKAKVEENIYKMI